MKQTALSKTTTCNWHQTHIKENSSYVFLHFKGSFFFHEQKKQKSNKLILGITVLNMILWKIFPSPPPKKTPLSYIFSNEKSLFIAKQFKDGLQKKNYAISLLKRRILSVLLPVATFLSMLQIPPEVTDRACRKLSLFARATLEI